MPNPTVPLAVDDHRSALAFARAFHDGDGDGAAELYDKLTDPLRTFVALANLFGSIVRDLAWELGQPEEYVWSRFNDYLEHPVEDFVRKRNRRLQ